MKSTNTIAQVKSDSSKISKVINGRVAVIVSTIISARKSQYGVQFWTSEMISSGYSTNTDRTTSVYIENL